MTDVDKVKCDCCKKEIPKSVALSLEAQDYVYHFCSHDCMNHFFEKNPHLKPNK